MSNTRHTKFPCTCDRKSVKTDHFWIYVSDVEETMLLTSLKGVSNRHRWRLIQWFKGGLMPGTKKVVVMDWYRGISLKSNLLSHLYWDPLSPWRESSYLSIQDKQTYLVGRRNGRRYSSRSQVSPYWFYVLSKVVERVRGDPRNCRSGTTTTYRITSPSLLYSG